MSFENFVFPHIRYIASDNYKKVKKTCKLEKKSLMNQILGNDIGLTDGKIYEFNDVMYSPDRETPYRTVLVTKNDNGKLVRLEENKTIWK